VASGRARDKLEPGRVPGGIPPPAPSEAKTPPAESVSARAVERELASERREALEQAPDKPAGCKGVRVASPQPAPGLLARTLPCAKALVASRPGWRTAAASDWARCAGWLQTRQGWAGSARSRLWVRQGKSPTLVAWSPYCRRTPGAWA
jgi:hypothetical protein